MLYRHALAPAPLPVQFVEPVNPESDESRALRKYANLLRFLLAFKQITLIDGILWVLSPKANRPMTCTPQRGIWSSWQAVLFKEKL